MKMSILRILTCFVALAASCVFALDGYTAGNWIADQYDLGTKTAPLAFLSPFHVRINFPKSCSNQCGEFATGGMPVFLFVCGFAGTIDAYNYDVILSGIARHGIIVVAVDRQEGYSLTLDYSTLGVQLQKVIGWIRSTDATQGLMATLLSQGFNSTLLNGASRIIFGGHTTGAALAIRNIRDTATLAMACPDPGGMVMINPVDGQDPLGFGGDGAIVKGQNLNFATPALIIGGSLDPLAPPAFIGLPCTPPDRSDGYFYNAWSGVVDYFTVTGVGTLDVLNEAESTSYDDACYRTPNNESALRTSYRTFVRGAVVNFIQNIVLNNAEYYTLMTEVPANLVDTTLESKGTGQANGRAFSCAVVTISQPMSFELQTGLILFGFTFALTFITGLYCFFRKMDDDTLHRYHPAEGVGYDQPASFQTKLEPQYGISAEYSSPQVHDSRSQVSRPPSINV